MELAIRNNLLKNLVVGVGSQMRFCDAHGYNTNFNTPIALTNFMFMPKRLNGAFARWFPMTTWHARVVAQRGNGEDILFSHYLKKIGGHYNLIGPCRDVVEPGRCNLETGVDLQVYPTNGFHTQNDHYVTRGRFCADLNNGTCDGGTCFNKSPHTNSMQAFPKAVPVFIGIPSHDLNCVIECVKSAVGQTYPRKHIVAYVDGMRHNDTELRLLPHCRGLCSILSNETRLGPAHARFQIMRHVWYRANAMDWLLFIDGDDTFVAATSLRQVFSFVTPTTWVATGKIVGLRSHECKRAEPMWRGQDFRRNDWRYCHPRLFRVFLIDIFDESDFQMYGRWLQKGTDRPLIYKLLETAGPTHITFVNHTAVKYNTMSHSTLKTLPAQYISLAKSYVQNRPAIAERSSALHLIVDNEYLIARLKRRILPNYKFIEFHVLHKRLFRESAYNDKRPTRNAIFAITYYSYTEGVSPRTKLAYYILSKHGGDTVAIVNNNCRGYIQACASAIVGQQTNRNVVFHSYDALIDRGVLSLLPAYFAGHNASIFEVLPFTAHEISPTIKTNDVKEVKETKGTEDVVLRLPIKKK